MTRMASSLGRGPRLGLRRNTPGFDFVPGAGALTLGGFSPLIGVGAPSIFVPDFYVSPNGSIGSGSIGDPWSLSYALSGAGGAITPGKQIALRGGTYTGSFISTLTGTVTSPIVVRQYPGERATIDTVTNNQFEIRGSDTWYQGFEVTNSAPVSGPSAFAGIYHHGPRTKLINLVVHEAGAGGITSNPSASPDSDLYGCIVYNCGTNFNQDHGLYVSNGSGVRLLAECIVFNNEKYGYHLNGGGSDLANIHLDGCIGFGNGSISIPVPISASGTLAGAAATGYRQTNCFTYEAPGSKNEGWGLGNFATPQGDGIITDNIFVHYVELTNWANLTFSRNTLFAPGGGGFTGTDQVLSSVGPYGGYTWQNNIHYRDSSQTAWGTGDRSGFTTLAAWKAATGLGSSDTNPAFSPSGVWSFVRPNAYEAGRANIVIYNWAHNASVAVDLSSVLSAGQGYNIFNVQDFFGAPVVSGTYAGGTVSIPMAGIAGPSVVGRPFTTPPVTGPEFQVFIVRLQGA